MAASISELRDFRARRGLIVETLGPDGALTARDHASEPDAKALSALALFVDAHRQRELKLCWSAPRPPAKWRSASAGRLETAAAVLGHNVPDSPWYKDADKLVRSGGMEPQEDKASWMSKAFKKIGLG